MLEMLCLDAIYLPNFVLLKSILYIFVHVRCVTCSWVDRLTTSSTTDDQTPDVSVSETWKEAVYCLYKAREDLRCSEGAREQNWEKRPENSDRVDFWNIRKRRLATPLAVRNAAVRAESPPRPFASFQVNFKKASRQASCFPIACRVALETNWA